MPKIVILGNSVSLKVRPPSRAEGGMTYAEHLMRQGWAVTNRSRAASMINEGFRWFDEDVIAEHPDVVVLHYGVVEACNRRHFRWISNAVTVNKFFNRVVGRNYEFSTKGEWMRRLWLRLCSRALDQVTKLVKIRWLWMSEDKFVECLRAMVAMTLKDTGARVYIMGVSPCDERIQRHMPGSMQNIERFNKCMRKVAAEFPAGVCFVDVCDILAGCSLEEVVPDGIHFSAAAHRLVGERMIKLIGGAERVA